jgi:hypothetical protein
LTRAHMATRQNPFLHPNVFFISCSPTCFIGTSIDFNVESSSFHSFRVNRLADPFRDVRYIICYAESFFKPMISHRISLENKPSTLVALSQTDILKITFQVINDRDEGVQPHQTFLRFYDEKSGEEGIQPIRVTPGGKAKFELVCYTKSTHITCVFVKNPFRIYPNHPSRYLPHPKATHYR